MSLSITEDDINICFSLKPKHRPNFIFSLNAALEVKSEGHTTSVLVSTQFPTISGLED